MFSQIASYPVGNIGIVGPNDRVVADLNGDGLSDVIVTVYVRGRGDAGGQAQTWVFLSEDGGFDGPTIYAAAQAGENGPGGVALGDLNRDGIPDLIVSTSGSLDVRLGLGGGLFGSEILIPAPCRGGAVRTIDANSDGWLDVAEVMDCGSVSGVVFLFLNEAHGDGILSDPLLTAQDTSGNNLAVGDFNGDGYTDLAYENVDGGLSWLENTGQGFDGGGPLWAFPLSPIVTLGSAPAGIGTVDDESLFTWRFNLYVCTPKKFVEGQPPSMCRGFIADFDVENADIAHGDVDGDGYPDFLLGGVEAPDGGSGVDVLLSDPAYPLEPPPGGQPLTGMQPLHQIAIGNLNDDSFGDLFVFRQDGPWEAWVNVCGPGSP